MDDSYRELAGAYALGALDPGEREDFARHLETGCAGCRDEVAAHAASLGRLLGSTPPVAPAAELRRHVLNLSEAPQPPIDLGAYTWDEPVPGIRMHVLREDPEQGTRSVLVWAKPGARYPSHRHLGDEDILVLQGALKDHRGAYYPGQVCRSRAGFVHSEEALPGEDCVCFVVYYGGHEAVPG